MKKCSYCNAEIEDSAKYCPFCGNQSGFTTSNDEKSTAFAILGFFLPLVGLILFCIWEKTYPLKAKSCGKGALIGVIVHAILSVLAFILMVLLPFLLID